MPAFRGKTLWFSALALWLTASPVGAVDAVDTIDTDDRAWAYSVVQHHLAETYSWQPSDYHLRILHADPSRVLVSVHHKDDEMTRSPEASGGKSFEIYLDEKTHNVVKELR